MCLDGIDKACQGEESQVLFRKYKIMKNQTYVWKRYPVIRLNFCTTVTTKERLTLSSSRSSRSTLSSSSLSSSSSFSSSSSSSSSLSILSILSI
ncbi:hypothetical protein HCN44_007551 [Aphidius gifuensis]|uniref:Uncharacterized protein n=1 Tax=Aphidius gifuensis TaxID=684658 RepID=A0A834XM38_APHGI|nr:hypothetical protein HCN44_007551 [Aphidius gifuensis]